VAGLKPPEMAFAPREEEADEGSDPSAAEAPAGAHSPTPEADQPDPPEAEEPGASEEGANLHE